jgi:hypothetical protein
LAIHRNSLNFPALPTMPDIWRQLITHPALAVASALLSGLVEVFALFRAHRWHGFGFPRRR